MYVFYSHNENKSNNFTKLQLRQSATECDKEIEENTHIQLKNTIV